jgi:hypothetical protein
MDLGRQQRYLPLLLLSSHAISNIARVVVCCVISASWYASDLHGKRENVRAGTDCRLGGWLQPEIVWAKLQAMTDAARLASAQLWRR